MFSNHKILKKIVLCLAMLLAVTMALWGCGKETEETAATEVTETAEVQTTAATEAHVQQELVVESLEDQDDMIVVTTSFGQVKYPYAFADLIQVKAVNAEDMASLQFTALISGDEYPLYALHFGGSEGIALGTLEIAGEAEPRAVFAAFFAADETALGDGASTFYAVQETFNDVVASLNEVPGFVSAS